MMRRLSYKDKEVLVSLKDVGLVYDSSDKPVEALKSIDLDIHQGEFICIMGPSGCGKSTLLKIIAGYLAPTSGSAKLRDKVITGPDRDRGVMFQSPTLYPWLSVRDNIEFGPKMAGVSFDERRKVSDEFLNRIQMLDFADHSVFELSGGMKQRVALARILVNHPEIILMDEPFGALDALTKLKMHKIVRRLWQNNNATVFMITHDIDEALSLATRLIIVTPSPGTIEESINLDFTFRALTDDKGRVRVDDEYLKIKEHILDIIE